MDGGNRVKSKKRKRWLFVGMLIAVVGLLLLLQWTSMTAWTDSGEEEWEEEAIEVERVPSYVLIMDLGSTGSRIQAFSWNSAVSGPLAAATVEIDQWNGTDVYMEVVPGVAHYNTDARVTAMALQPLLDFATAYLRSVDPAIDFGEVPLFIFGTGGLRSISPEHAEEILEQIWTLVEGQEAAFMTRRRWLRVIDGQLEAVFDWIAVQVYSRLGEVPVGVGKYIKAHFDDGGGERTKAMLKTIATMDLGGSSVEIAFAVEKSVAEDERFALPQPKRAYYFVPDSTDQEDSEATDGKSPIRTVALGLKSLDLYAKAFESGGHNYFRKALVHSWIHVQKMEGNVRDSQGRLSLYYPCSHRGIRYSEFYDGGLYVLNGSGDVAQCLAFMHSLMMGTLPGCLEKAECSEPMAIVPNVTRGMAVVCTERFASLANFFSLGFHATPRQLLEKTTAYCEREWDDIWNSLHHKETLDPIVVSNYCTSGLQAYSIFKRFGLDDDTQQVFFKPSTVQLHTSWTIGAATFVVQNNLDFDGIRFD